MPTSSEPPDHTRPQTPSREDPREAWQTWAQGEFPSATEAALEAALTVIDAGGAADVAVAAAHRAALLHSVDAPAPRAPGPVVSPDGRHWWDGAVWQEVRVTPAQAMPHDSPPGVLAPRVGTSPDPWAPPPAWPAPPASRIPAGILGAALAATAVAAAIAVIGVVLTTRHTSSSTTGTSTSGGTVATVPGTSHCTYRISDGSFSLITDAVDAPIDCATLQASFEAAERSAGAAVTPIDRVPSGATSACSHQFGSSGYAVTIYNDPSSGEDGAIGQAFVQAACGAFLHVAGGS
ncbi:MAG: hypothetical protein E6I76_13565 [Chloroflexi bacterium]|nr:MAG: hypothetical protein E6I76_13565 [Chloroflexota bacterium]